MFREGEHRDTNVCEYEVFRQKVKEFEQLLCSVAGVRRQVVVCVMGLTYTAKKHSHNA